MFGVVDGPGCCDMGVGRFVLCQSVQRMRHMPVCFALYAGTWA